MVQREPAPINILISFFCCGYTLRFDEIARNNLYIMFHLFQCHHTWYATDNGTMQKYTISWNHNEIGTEHIWAAISLFGSETIIKLEFQVNAITRVEVLQSFLRWMSQYWYMQPILVTCKLAYGSVGEALVQIFISRCPIKSALLFVLF